MDKSDIAQIIRDRAAANGVDPQMLLRIGQVESGLDPNAAASGSSAKGLMQFTKGTWDQYGNGTDPLDPSASADAGARLLKDNAASLRSAGIDPSPGAVYLAHFSGIGGARKLLTADPSQPVSEVLGQAAVSANPFLAKMTVADLKGWASQKIGGSSSTAVPAASPRAAPQAPTGMLNSLPTSETEQPASPTEDVPPIQMRVAQQQQAPPPTLPPIQMAALRRVDPNKLRQLLQAPLSRGFSFG